MNKYKQIYDNLRNSLVNLQSMKKELSTVLLDVDDTLSDLSTKLENMKNTENISMENNIAIDALTNAYSNLHKLQDIRTGLSTTLLDIDEELGVFEHNLTKNNIDVSIKCTVSEKPRGPNVRTSASIASIDLSNKDTPQEKKSKKFTTSYNTSGKIQHDEEQHKSYEQYPLKFERDLILKQKEESDTELDNDDTQKYKPTIDNIKLYLLIEDKLRKMIPHKIQYDDDEYDEYEHKMILFENERNYIDRTIKDNISPIIEKYKYDINEDEEVLYNNLADKIIKKTQYGYTKIMSGLTTEKIMSEREINKSKIDVLYDKCISRYKEDIPILSDTERYNLFNNLKINIQTNNNYITEEDILLKQAERRNEDTQEFKFEFKEFDDTQDTIISSDEMSNLTEQLRTMRNIELKYNLPPDKDALDIVNYNTNDDERDDLLLYPIKNE